MQRAHEGADAAAAAAATVAPLLQLKRAAQKAENLARFARAVELIERALAAAELAQPRDSLIIAALLSDLFIAHFRASQASNPAVAATMGAMLRSFHLLHLRWQAGTLFTPTAEEVAYLVEDEDPFLPAQMCGAFFYIRIAESWMKMLFRRVPCTPVEAEAHLRAVYGALRAALETDARGMLEGNPRAGQACPASSNMMASAERSSRSSCQLKSALHRFVIVALSEESGLLPRMRAGCGMSSAEETALRRLAERYKAVNERSKQELPSAMEMMDARQQQAAAADAARHGLRRCVLPSCDAQEPHPKLFKLCCRCRGAAYCGAAHCAEDWKRHKREDSCKAAP
jgi:hypothetical protein